MTTLFAWAFASAVALLLIVWLGPHLIAWAGNCYMSFVYRTLRKFEERRQERHKEIRTALADLERAMEARRDQS